MLFYVQVAQKNFLWYLSLRAKKNTEIRQNTKFLMVGTIKKQQIFFFSLVHEVKRIVAQNFFIRPVLDHVLKNGMETKCGIISEI